MMKQLIVSVPLRGNDSRNLPPETSLSFISSVSVPLRGNDSRNVEGVVVKIDQKQNVATVITVRFPLKPGMPPKRRRKYCPVFIAQVSVLASSM